MRNMKDLNRILAEREGLKEQLPISQIGEVSGHLSELVATSPEVIAILIENGLRRIRAKDRSGKKKRRRR